jgi:hypothetical protein
MHVLSVFPILKKILVALATNRLKPVLVGVDGNLHFQVPSMNRLNQTEPATFSILPCWAFFRDSVYIYFKTWQI